MTKDRAFEIEDQRIAQKKAEMRWTENQTLPFAKPIKESKEARKARQLKHAYEHKREYALKNGSHIRFGKVQEKDKLRGARKPLKKRGVDTIGKVKKRCIALAKLIVKMRDNYTCQKCGKTVEKSNCQASHVAPVSSGNILCADPLNMKVLCHHDHLNWWHKDPIAAGIWFAEKFPERAKYIAERRQQIVHWKLYDWLEKEQQLKEQLATLQEGR